MSMGKRLASTTPDMVRKLSGHSCMGPSGVADQSKVRTRSAMPTALRAAMVSVIGGLDASRRGGSGRAAVSAFTTWLTSERSEFFYLTVSCARYEPNTSDYLLRQPARRTPPLESTRDADRRGTGTVYAISARRCLTRPAMRERRQ